MKKIINLLTYIFIFSFCLLGCGNQTEELPAENAELSEKSEDLSVESENFVQESETEEEKSEDVAGKKELVSDLNQWTGYYTFEEAIDDPVPMVMGYWIIIYEEDDAYYANIEICGQTTWINVKATVDGNKEEIGLYYLEPLPNNPWGVQYEQGEELLRFKRENGIYTYWGAITPMIDENNTSGGTYFTREWNVLIMDEYKRQDLLARYEPINHMQYKEKEDRVKNSFFKTPDYAEQMVVRYENTEYLLSGNGEPMTYANVIFSSEYLFSYEKGDVYVLWYPDFNEEKEPILAGYFYVTGDEIRQIMPNNIVYELKEEDILSGEKGFLVCTEAVTETTCFDEVWDTVAICQQDDFVVTYLRDGYHYMTYVWEKDIGMAGYQYGCGVGGDQHDFYVTEEVFENFLRMGWDTEEAYGGNN